MDPKAFVAAHKGQPVWLLDSPATGNRECVALFRKFNQGHANETYSAGGAIDLCTLVDWDSYEKIPTTEPAILGDWLIWSGSHGAYQNYIPALGRGAGHVAMFLSDNGNNTGDCFTQNPGNANVLPLSYNGVVGYLRPKTKASTMGYFINGLAGAIRQQDSGLRVIEVNGWKSRGYAGRGVTKIVGTMWHHTATGRSAFLRSVAPTLNIVTHGHASLPGPLCHILLARDGSIYVVSSGWANHAGTGKWTDIPWHHGNDYTIGIEMESSGIRPWDWTPEQLDAAPRLGAALRRIFAINNDMSHQEYSDAGKIDPAGWPGGMDGLRRQITAVYNGNKTPEPPKPEPAKPEPEKDWLDMVTQAQLEESLVKVNQRFVGDVVNVPNNYGTDESRKKNPTWAAQNVWTQIWGNSIEAEKHSKRAAEAAERSADALEMMPKMIGDAIIAATAGQSSAIDPTLVREILTRELAAAVDAMQEAWIAQVQSLDAQLTAQVSLKPEGETK